MCCVIPGLFSFPMGALQFMPMYHTFHDNFEVHTEVCVFCLVAVYALIAWSGDRNPEPEARPRVGRATNRGEERGWGEPRSGRAEGG